MSELLGLNPLYQLFNGDTYALAFTTTIALFVIMLVTLGYHKWLTATVVFVSLALTLFGGINMAVEEPQSRNLTSAMIWSFVVALAWTGYAVYNAATHRDYKRTLLTSVTLIVSNLTMASLLLTFVAGQLISAYRVGTDDWLFWINLENYLWGADFVLLMVLVLTGLTLRGTTYNRKRKLAQVAPAEQTGSQPESAPATAKTATDS